VTTGTPPEIQALPLSLAQRPLWFLQRLDPSGSAYNVPMVMTVRGPLEGGRLRRALETVVERHEALRTTFEVFDGEPVQVFHPSMELPWEEVDLSGLGDDERRRALDRLGDEEGSRPFDLVRGPLLRSRLARTGEGEHVWFLTFHHVVFDGWSQEVLLDELGSLYGDPAGDLPELPIQYADFSAWQEEELSGERLEGLIGFWRRELEGFPTVLRLPTDRPRPARQSFRGEVATALLPAEVWRRAETLADAEGASPFMVFLAIWMTVLHRLSGAERLVVGTPSAGRNHPAAEGLIGNFVNTLAVGGDLSGDPTFRSFLARVRERTLAAIAHQELMFDQIVEALDPDRAGDAAPPRGAAAQPQPLPGRRGREELLAEGPPEDRPGLAPAVARGRRRRAGGQRSPRRRSGRGALLARQPGRVRGPRVDEPDRGPGPADVRAHRHRSG
jgi:hypothetical protein